VKERVWEGEREGKREDEWEGVSECVCARGRVFE
jgi:hypothetical protein